MKTNVFLQMVFLLFFAVSCHLTEDVFPLDEDVSFVADITEKTNYHFLAFTKSDGSFLEVKQVNGLPVEAVFKPSENQDAHPVWFDNKGYPEMMVAQKYILLFANFTTTGFDMAMVSPEGEVTVMREIPVPEAYREFLRLKSVKTADALRHAGHFLGAVTSACAILGSSTKTMTGYTVSKDAAVLLKNLGHGSKVITLASGFADDDNIPVLSALSSKSIRQFTRSSDFSSVNGYDCLLSVTGVALGTAGSITGKLANELELARGVLPGGYGDIQVTMTWDTPSDIDLYVQDPSGDWVWFKNRISASGGRLDIDDQNGYGPENIFWEKNMAPVGTFSVVIENFEGVTTYYSILVQAFGLTKQYQGTISTKQELRIAEFSNTQSKESTF